jgi:protoporphyrinogen oxidase
MEIDNVILGAGIAGLAYAHELKKTKKKAVIFEAESFAGGLCRSFAVQGFVFDSAAHASFTENTVARNLFDKTSYTTHEPVAYNFHKGHWLKHPVVNNLYPLDVADKVSYIKSFVERKEIEHITDYGQWLYASYGEELARQFYHLYTRKYWTVEPDELTASWVGIRLAKTDLSKILFGAFSSVTGIDSYAQKWRYPLNGGGYQAFLKPLLDDTNIEYNKKAIKINLNEKTILFSDGVLIAYKKLISSMPLPEFVATIEQAPEEIRVKAQKLKATKVSLISIGFNRLDIPKHLFFYIYDKDIMAARANSPSLLSEKNVPPGCSSIQFEIYHHPDSVINQRAVIENTLQGIKKMNLCKEDDIMFVDYRLLPYGNVLFLHGMEKERDCIRTYIQNQGVDLIGRFGEWDYLWSDQSYLSGVMKAKKEKI